MADQFGGRYSRGYCGRYTNHLISAFTNAFGGITSGDRTVMYLDYVKIVMYIGEVYLYLIPSNVDLHALMKFVTAELLRKPTVTTDELVIAYKNVWTIFRYIHMLPPKYWCRLDVITVYDECVDQLSYMDILSDGNSRDIFIIKDYAYECISKTANWRVYQMHMARMSISKAMAPITGTTYRDYALSRSIAERSIRKRKTAPIGYTVIVVD